MHISVAHRLTSSHKPRCTSGLAQREKIICLSMMVHLAASHIELHAGKISARPISVLIVLCKWYRVVTSWILDGLNRSQSRGLNGCSATLSTTGIVFRHIESTSQSSVCLPLNDCFISPRLHPAYKWVYRGSFQRKDIHLIRHIDDCDFPSAHWRNDQESSDDDRLSRL